MSYKKPIIIPNLKPKKGINNNAKMKAKNSTASAEELFEQRKFYRDFSWQNQFVSEFPISNYWDKNGFLYGKVDMNGDSVILNEYNLKQFSEGFDTHFAINFVVDAFEEMRLYLRRYKANMGIRSISRADRILFDLPVAKSWRSLNHEYSKYLQAMAQAFTDNYLTHFNQKKIMNFETFLKVYIESTVGVTRAFPLSLTGFLRSKYCDPAVGGLIVETYDLDDGNDDIKKGFLTSPSLPLYMDITRRHGFYVDKNAPWRLTANVARGMNLSKHMSTYGYKTNNNKMNEMFDKFYNSGFAVEIPVLRHYMVSIYNSYVTTRPTLSIGVVKSCKIEKQKSKLLIKTIDRKPEDCFVGGQLDLDSKYAKKYDELFWIRFYYFLRMHEEGMPVNDFLLNKNFTNKILPYYRVHGLNRTIQAINREIFYKIQII